MGNPEFGQVSAVFSPNYVHNLTLIAPVDTGAWCVLRLFNCTYSYLLWNLVCTK